MWTQLWHATEILLSTVMLVLQYQHTIAVLQKSHLGPMPTMTEVEAGLVMVVGADMDEAGAQGVRIPG